MPPEYVDGLMGKKETGLEFLSTTVVTSGEIFKELLRASMSNPLMGIMACFIAGATFHKAKVITDQEWANLKIMIFAAGGISLTVDLIQQLETVVVPALGLFNKTSDSLTKPTGTVLVFGDTTSSQLNALLQGHK